MRSPLSFAIAVRRATGEIVVRERCWKHHWTGSDVGRAPYLGWMTAWFDHLRCTAAGLSFAAAQLDRRKPLASASIGMPQPMPDRLPWLGLAWIAISPGRLRRMLRYHLAQRQVVLAYEAGASLELTNMSPLQQNRLVWRWLDPPDEAMLEVALVALRACLSGGADSSGRQDASDAALYQNLADVCSAGMG